jgi:hypothetical protein
MEVEEDEDEFQEDCYAALYIVCFMCVCASSLFLSLSLLVITILPKD